MRMDKLSGRRIWWLALLLLSLTLAGIFAVGMRDLLIALVTPLLGLIWFIDMLPEYVIWVVVVILGAIVALAARGALTQREGETPPALPPANIAFMQTTEFLGTVKVLRALRKLTPGPTQQGGKKALVSSTKSETVASIASLVQRSKTSATARDILGRHLAELAVSLLCRRRCISPPEAWRLMHRGKWPTDQRIYRTLFPQESLFPTNKHLDDLQHALEFLEDYDRGGADDNP